MVDTLIDLQQQLRRLSPDKQLEAALILVQLNKEDPLAYQVLEEHLQNSRYPLSRDQLLQILEALLQKNKVFTKEQQGHLLKRFQSIPLEEWNNSMYTILTELHAVPAQLAAFLISTFEQKPKLTESKLFAFLLQQGAVVFTEPLLGQLKHHAIYQKLTEFYVGKFLQAIEKNQSISEFIILGRLDLSSHLPKFIEQAEKLNQLPVEHIAQIFISTPITALVESLNKHPTLATRLKDAFEQLVESKLWRDDLILRQKNDDLYLFTSDNEEIKIPDRLSQEFRMNKDQQVLTH